MRRAVVTGAAGHVGTNLVTALLRRGVSVTGVDVAPLGPARRIGSGQLNWVVADVRDPAAMRAAMIDVDVVFHCAAVISVAGGRRGLVESVNVTGTRTVVGAALAARVERLVHCSSVHAYDLGACRGTTISETSPRATPACGAYDRSKAAAEIEVRAGMAHGLDAVIVNPTAIIGPADPGASRMGRLLRAVQVGRMPFVVPGGFDWVDVRDVVASMIAAADRGVTGGNYLLAGHRLTMTELMNKAAHAAGRRYRPRCIPQAVAGVAALACTALARTLPAAPLPTTEALTTLSSFPAVDDAAARRDLDHRARPIEQTLTDLHRAGRRLADVT